MGLGGRWKSKLTTAKKKKKKKKKEWVLQPFCSLIFHWFKQDHANNNNPFSWGYGPGNETRQLTIFLLIALLSGTLTNSSQEILHTMHLRNQYIQFIKDIFFLDIAVGVKPCRDFEISPFVFCSAVTSTHIYMDFISLAPRQSTGKWQSKSSKATVSI